MIVSGRTPVASAAAMKSCRRIDSTIPRITRASPGHPTSAKIVTTAK